jgi:FAD/FMN-containing dehydrogenase
MTLAPTNIAELSKALADANSRKAKIERVDLGKLNRVLEHTPEDMTVTVEAGITLADLQKHVGQRRQWLAIDPPHPEVTTIGNIINANSSGPRRFGCGTIRDYLIGLTAVLADGTIIHSGGKVVKNVAGYDLMKMFISGQGTVGVVVEATFKLRPLPEAEQFLAAQCESLEASAKLIESVIQSEMTPTVLDLYGEPLNPVNAFFSPAGRPTVQKPPVIISYNVVIGFAGCREEVDWQVARAGELGFKRNTSLGYESLFWADPAPVHRVSVLPSRLMDTLQSAKVPFVARAGNGVIYHLGDLAIKLPDKSTAAVSKIMTRLKDAYDPNHIFPELPL